LQGRDNTTAAHSEIAAASQRRAIHPQLQERRL